MALVESTMVPLGTKAHDFKLHGTDGKAYSLTSFTHSKVIVIVFMCNHCPYVKAVLQRLINLQNEFINRGVQFIGINSNDATSYPDDSLENMKIMAKEKKVLFSLFIRPKSVNS
jgi:peroxiredoxin